MSYIDYNGNITIDEVAARRDITRINNAGNSLNQAFATVDHLISELSNMEGEAVSAALDKAHELRKRIVQLCDNLEASATLINTTVVQYQTLDRNVRKKILSSK